MLLLWNNLPKLINEGPTSIPEPRVCTLYDCTCLAYNLIWKKSWNFSVRWCRKGRKLYFARKKMMTAGKNNGAKPFLMTYFNSYIHKISFEFLIVFYLPIARVECFLKYSLKKKFKCKSKTALTPLLHIDPELVTKNGSSKRLRGHPCTNFFFYAFFSIQPYKLHSLECF